MNALVSAFAERAIPERFFHWDSLLSISRTPLSSIGIYVTIFIPFLGVTLSFLSDLSVIDDQPVMSMGLSWSMLASYLSALVFSAASIATTLLCPQDIQSHTNFKSYLFALLEVGNSLKVASDKAENGLTAITLSSENQADMERFIRELAEKKASEDFYVTYQRVIENAPSEWSKTLEDKRECRMIIGYFYIASILVASILFFIRTPVYILFSV